MGTVASSHKSAKTASHLVSMLRDFESATLVTRSRSGSLHARPMSIAQVDHNATLWFITSVASAKVDEVPEDARAMVTLQSASRFVSLNGNAELVFDPERIRALWRDAFAIWFNGAWDPDIVVVRFQAFDAEYWDNSGMQGFKQALRAARAYVTGHKLEGKAEFVSDANAHAKIRLWDPPQALEPAVGRTG